MARAPIQPLAWEPPYALGAALNKKTKNKNKTKKKPAQVSKPLKNIIESLGINETRIATLHLVKTHGYVLQRTHLNNPFHRQLNTHIPHGLSAFWFGEQELSSNYF